MPAAPDSTIEVWKPVVNYEGIYSVSNLGRVRREISFKRASVRLLKPVSCPQGYLSVKLNWQAKGKTFRIHRLVAIAYVPNPLNKPEVNHIDGVKTNNRDSNLEWATPKENMQHAHYVLHAINRRGKENGRAKLTEETVKEVRQLAQSRENFAEIGRKFGVTKEAIGYAVRRVTWRNVL
jgi:hypothetical protein